MAIDNTPGTRYDIGKDNELVPTVWPFKLEWMEFTGPEGLDKWEEAMRTKVGLTIDAKMYKPGCATISGSGDGWDDCDYWGNGC